MYDCYVWWSKRLESQQYWELCWGVPWCWHGGSETCIYDGHYRRFIELSELVKKLEGIGFTVLEQEESNLFAPQHGKNAVCVRVVSQKTECWIKQLEGTCVI